MQGKRKAGWMKRILAIGIVAGMLCSLNGCSADEKSEKEVEKMYNMEEFGEKLQIVVG